MRDPFLTALDRYERDGSGYVPDAETAHCVICGAAVYDAEGDEVICDRCWEAEYGDE